MPDLTLPHDDKVYVAGDLAFLEQPDGRVVPALAPAAKQMGRLVAQNLQRALSGKPRRAFCYRDRGTLATIGRSRGVGVIGPLKLSGMVAWLAWLFVHLVFLVGFKSRILVLFEWIWSYVTFQRGARVLIEPAVLMGRLLASRHGAPTRGRLSHVEITASSAAPSSP
jgi:NADH dehydrogenase